MIENINLDIASRNDLIAYTVRFLCDSLHESAMTKMGMIEEKDRYYNWYNGISEVKLPNLSNDNDDNQMIYFVETLATSGTIFTKHFGEKFNPKNVQKNILLWWKVYIPDAARNNKNVTLHFDLEKITMKGLSTGEDKLTLSNVENIGTDTQFFSKNYTPGIGFYGAHEYIRLTRNVVFEDVEKQRLDLMPGFKLSWHYTGMEVKPDEDNYIVSENDDTMPFVR